MAKCWHRLCHLIFYCVLANNVWAGGSGLNVVVVVNQKSTNSVQLGNYYSEKRQVPPQNYLRINWSGGDIGWTNSDFNTYLLTPLLSLLSSRQLTNQIDYVVLCMDIPYQLLSSNADNINSTTSALFYGIKTNTSPPAGAPPSCSLPSSASNAYAASECIFRSTPPINPNSNSFLVTMITASNLPAAQMVVDQGAISDSTFPAQTVFLAKSTDTARNIRYQLFDNAIFNTRLLGNYSMERTNVSYDWNFGDCLGLQSGVYGTSVSPTSFAPGGMADNLTSYGGLLFTDNSGQLKLFAFLAAGAAGSYGTVDEPCAYLEKFPTPLNYFYQGRGFSLAECYYQSVSHPYQGLLLGEPLAAPFALPCSGDWSNLSPKALLTGMTNLTLQFNANDADHPIQQVDLFVDGTFAQTLTNIPPRTNNILHVAINGFPTNYTVPAGATIKSIASNLTSRLNTSSYSNLTKVAAFAHGDRIELQSMDRSRTGAEVAISTSNSIGTASALTTRIASSAPGFLDTAASGIRGFQINGTPLATSFLQLLVTKTNGAQVSLGVTNNSTLTLAQMAQRLIDLINTNTNPSLQGPEGVTASDLVMDSNTQVEFNLLANSPGWDAAQVQADINGTVAVFSFTPSGSVKLDENLHDLQPRNYLYVTAGVTNLPFTFAFNSTNQPDGYHQLTAVGYEGSHVRTQQRISRNVRIQNGSLSATFTTLFGGSNTVVGATLQFSVVASTNNISRIELFSTGGALTNITGQSNAIFSVVGTNLGIGLHPFYAIVTGTNGKQYRTETKWIRLIGAETAFPLTITSPPPSLAWPATVGRRYDILSTTNITDPFELRDSVTPSNSEAQWIETNLGAPQRFYRVQSTN